MRTMRVANNSPTSGDSLIVGIPERWSARIEDRRSRRKKEHRRARCSILDSRSSILDLFSADLQIVKVGLRVGLGPETDLAGFREHVVLGVQHFLPVQEALDVVA